jgi:hypothetical protein
MDGCQSNRVILRKLGKLGFFADAEPLLARAIALRPSYQLARNNLAWVRGELARR